MTITKTTPFLKQLTDKINEEMGKDFDIFFNLRQKPLPEDPIALERHERVTEYIRDVTQVAALYPFCREINLDLHLAHKPKYNGEWPQDSDISAALVAAFHSTVRTPNVGGILWTPHMYSAKNTCLAAETLEGEILTCATETIVSMLAEFGYTKPFEGFPVDVANDIRKWMSHAEE